jgi:hypothetical protein
LEGEEVELFAFPPLRKDNSLRPVMLGDPGQSRDVMRSGTRGRASFRLDQDQFEKIPTLQTRNGLPMILPDSHEVHDAA